MVATADEPLDAAKIEAALGDRRGRFHVLVRERCGSTNSELRALAEEGAAHATVLVCEEQSAGRGRRGRIWRSVRGGGLTFSLLWRLAPHAPAPTGLSLAAGVALARALESFGVTGLRLKWPNDLLLDGRKLGGILVETTTGPHPGAVIGVGLNVALPADFDTGGEFGAADLAAALSPRPSRNRLLGAVLCSLAAVLDRFALEGFRGLRQDWLDRAAWLGEPVRLGSQFAPPVEGTLAGIDADGAALIAGREGVRRVASGELSLRRAS